MVGAFKGKDLMGVRVAGRGARDRGDRRKEVEVDPKYRSLGHDVSNLVLAAVEESCACGEDRVLVGLRELTRKLEELLTLAVHPALLTTFVLKLTRKIQTRANAKGGRRTRHDGDRQPR